jgi:hypothetical protein
LQCADGKQVHGFHQDPSQMRKASLSSDVECQRRENCEQALVLPRASSSGEIVEALGRAQKSLPFRAAPTPGGLRSAQDLLSREYPTSA